MIADNQTTQHADLDSLHSHSACVSRVDDQTRLFKPFFDPIDGILFVSANASAIEVDSQIGAHQLRFPLFLDRTAPLAEQLLASSHAPASSRFGPFCDHIVGMNWCFSDGRIVRLGERVAKTTTGYDVFRFFLNAGERFGKPQDLILRLRPKTDLTMVSNLSGAAPQITAAAKRILSTCWLHWLDAIDLIADGSQVQLRIQTHCPAHEWIVFENFFQKLSDEFQLTLNSSASEHLLTDGLPDVVIKTTPDHLAAITIDIASRFDARCVGLCYPAVLHVFANSQTTPNELLHRLQATYGSALKKAGGDIHSRHLPPEPPTGVEAHWINTFMKEAGIQ